MRKLMTDEGPWHCYTRPKRIPATWEQQRTVLLWTTTGTWAEVLCHWLWVALPLLKMMQSVGGGCTFFRRKRKYKTCLWKEMHLRETQRSRQAEAHWPRLGKVASGQASSQDREALQQDGEKGSAPECPWPHPKVPAVNSSNQALMCPLTALL